MIGPFKTCSLWGGCVCREGLVGAEGGTLPRIKDIRLIGWLLGVEEGGEEEEEERRWRDIEYQIRVAYVTAKARVDLAGFKTRQTTNPGMG